MLACVSCILTDASSGEQDIAVLSCRKGRFHAEHEAREVSMELDDVMDPKVGAVVATAAVVASPPARRLLHQGIVLGVTGVLFVTDAIGALGRGVARGVR